MHRLREFYKILLMRFDSDELGISMLAQGVLYKYTLSNAVFQRMDNYTKRLVVRVHGLMEAKFKQLLPQHQARDYMREANIIGQASCAIRRYNP